MSREFYVNRKTVFYALGSLAVVTGAVLGLRGCAQRDADQSALDSAENQAQNTLQVPPPTLESTTTPDSPSAAATEHALCRLNTIDGRPVYGYVDFGSSNLKNPYTYARYPNIPDPDRQGRACTETLPRGCSPSEYTFYGNAMAFGDPYVFDNGQMLQAYGYDEDGSHSNDEHDINKNDKYYPLGEPFLAENAEYYKLAVLPGIEYLDAMCEIK